MKDQGATTGVVLVNAKLSTTRFTEPAAALVTTSSMRLMPEVKPHPPRLVADVIGDAPAVAKSIVSAVHATPLTGVRMTSTVPDVAAVLSTTEKVLVELATAADASPNR